MNPPMRYQYFCPPSDFDASGMEKSPWFRNGTVWFFRDAWEKVLKYMLEHNPDLEKKTWQLSHGDSKEDFWIDPVKAGLSSDFLEGIERVREELDSMEELPIELIPKGTDHNFPISEYLSMLDWFHWVISESLRLKKPFQAYID
jgi:hypothetical protein